MLCNPCLKFWAEYAAYEDATILGKWGEVIPAENIITLGSPKAIVDAMLGVVALTEGKRDLEKVSRVARYGDRMGSERAHWDAWDQTVLLLRHAVTSTPSWVALSRPGLPATSTLTT